ncbi:hypothetical protein DFP78_107228 [Photobacterium lutimaris]|nr:hypothetical protein DFP78_107228 [Photobacterium lutimaris]
MSVVMGEVGAFNGFILPVTLGIKKVPVAQRKQPGPCSLFKYKSQQCTASFYFTLTNRGGLTPDGKWVF